MSQYKLASLILEFIKAKQPGFHSHENFLHQLHCAMIDKDDGENENSIRSSNKLEKIVIKSRTTCIVWNKQGYHYTDIKKGVFFNGHEWPDVIEYLTQFSKKLEVLSLYLVEFHNDCSLEEKVYLFNCVVNILNKRLVILII